MNRKRRKLNDDEEEEWNSKMEGKASGSKKKKYAGETCFIHCTNSNEPLVKLPTLESWKKLLEAAQVRENEKVLELAKETEAEDIPIIYYHMKCRKAFTHDKSLQVIKKVSPLKLQTRPFGYYHLFSFSIASF